MTQEQIIENTIGFVKETLKGAEGGHDWFHIERVYKNALLICETESVDLFVVQLGALLHDIADAKFYDGDESVGPNKALDFLNTQEVATDIIAQVIYIIKNVSFKNSLDSNSQNSPAPIELQVVRDADRLDAIGAIGIARAFNYGGFKNRQLYDPSVPPQENLSKEAYKKISSPTINHFYEKLLTLKEKMHTKTAKKIALKRHSYMEAFLEQFYAEWNGER